MDEKSNTEYEKSIVIYNAMGKVMIFTYSGANGLISLLHTWERKNEMQFKAVT